MYIDIFLKLKYGLLTIQGTWLYYLLNLAVTTGPLQIVVGSLNKQILNILKRLAICNF